MRLRDQYTAAQVTCHNGNKGIPPPVARTLRWRNHHADHPRSCRRSHATHSHETSAPARRRPLHTHTTRAELGPPSPRIWPLPPCVCPCSIHNKASRSQHCVATQAVNRLLEKDAGAQVAIERSASGDSLASSPSSTPVRSTTTTSSPRPLAARRCAISSPASVDRGCGGMVRRRSADPAFRAKAKFKQIQQNPAKRGQRKSKENACIGLDSLVRIGPFQWVALSARAFFCWPPCAFIQNVECILDLWMSGVMARKAYH